MRRTLWDVVRDALRRQQEPSRRTRIVTPHWRWAHERIVHPETDLSEWVHKVADRDWQNVVEGRDQKYWRR